MADFHIEKGLIRQGYRIIAGVDEVGRGALFGPVVASAVIIPAAAMGAKLPGWLLGIDDSKLLTPRNRQRLARRILIEAAAVGVGIVSNEEIDQENISRASFLAMRKAVANLGISPEILLVDGYGIKDYPFPQRGVVQGDKKSLSIAAASIVAKVLRDEMMACLDRVFEGYSLGRNKGYGTREHFRALEALGCTSFHRRSFNLKS